MRTTRSALTLSRPARSCRASAGGRRRPACAGRGRASGCRDAQPARRSRSPRRSSAVGLPATHARCRRVRTRWSPPAHARSPKPPAAGPSCRCLSNAAPARPRFRPGDDIECHRHPGPRRDADQVLRPSASAPKASGEQPLAVVVQQHRPTRRRQADDIDPAIVVNVHGHGLPERGVRRAPPRNACQVLHARPAQEQLRHRPATTNRSATPSWLASRTSAPLYLPAGRSAGSAR